MITLEIAGNARRGAAIAANIAKLPELPRET
jgi:hypothetical protein